MRTRRGKSSSGAQLWFVGRPHQIPVRLRTTLNVRMSGNAGIGRRGADTKVPFLFIIIGFMSPVKARPTGHSSFYDEERYDHTDGAASPAGR
jgi:hypothetical protein